MRISGIFAMCLLLGACATPPLFPPEIMKDVETTTFDFKAWEKEAFHPSSGNVVSHKVELGGQIMRMIPKPDGVVLLVIMEPLGKYRGHDFTRVEQDDSFWYAIAFNGFPEPSMLRRGNKLVVVGTTDRATEMIAGVPIVLPHLQAQCLRIWQIDELEANRFPYGDTVGYYPPDRTFCDESKGRSVSTE